MAKKTNKVAPTKPKKPAKPAQKDEAMSADELDKVAGGMTANVRFDSDPDIRLP